MAIPTDGTEKTYIFSSDKGKTATKTWTLEKNVFYTKAGAEGAGTGDAIVIEPDAPATPKFTVGMDGDTPITVEFAPGNLYWDGTDSKWKFEANQWDFRHYNGNDDDAAVIGGESTTTPAGTVGSFFWSKNSLVAVASSYSDPSASTDDTFFTNANDFQVDGKAAGTWRTLSKDEWIYLLNTSNASSGARTDANRFAKARVSGVVGLLVFPDRYTGTASGDGIATVNDISAAYPTASISSDTWTSMESVGAVFLPAAGFRYDTSVRNVGSFGFYWSSSYNDSNSAYYLNFNSVSVSPSFSSYRYNGFSVRLVSEN